MKEYKKLFFIVGVIFFFLSAYFFDVDGKTIISKILYAIGAMFVFTFMTSWQKKDTFYPSPCGARCVECPSYPKECKGCRKIKGEVYWLQYTGHTVCPIWKCCKEKKRENCGGCPELPCSRFMKDPSISYEENEANLKKMMANLASDKKSMDNDK